MTMSLNAHMVRGAVEDRLQETREQLHGLWGGCALVLLCTFLFGLIGAPTVPLGLVLLITVLVFLVGSGLLLPMMWRTKRQLRRS